MRWKDIVEGNLIEATDYNCPECGDYLGKESEVIANDNEYCGRCGWEAKKKSNKPASTPTPAPKPLPKSKQTIVKTSGEYEARIYPGRNAAGLYFLGKQRTSYERRCKGEVKKTGDGQFVPTWYASDYHEFVLPAMPTMTAAINAIKTKHKKLLKAKPGTKYNDI